MRQKKAALVCVLAVLVIMLAFTFLPIYIMLINSFKTRTQILAGIILPSFPLFFANYKYAFTTILPYVFNSFLVTICSVAGVILLSAVAGFAFGHYRFRGKKLLFTLVLVNMMIPSVLTLIPNFYIISNVIPLYDTLLALIVPYIVGGQVMGIYLVRGFVEELPASVFEAARIDGAGEFKLFSVVAVPLIKPIITTVAILNMINVWNDIVWPQLVLETQERQTIPLGLLAFNSFIGQDYGKVFAGYVISSVPLMLFFFFNMRGFMDSLAEGALK